MCVIMFSMTCISTTIDVQLCAAMTEDAHMNVLIHCVGDRVHSQLMGNSK